MDTPLAFDVGAGGSKRGKEYHNRDFTKRRKKNVQVSYRSSP